MCSDCYVIVKYLFKREGTGILCHGARALRVKGHTDQLT